MTIHEKEPIAIVGIGCRFPGGASNPQKFWEMLCKGTDAVIEVPRNRWDLRRFYHENGDLPVKASTKKGGFLKEKWDEFDPEFFQISPREAEYLDPQQRLLLELTWEAFEDAGILPKDIRGTNAGVFIGAFTTDWQTLHNSPYNVGHCGRYSGINGSMTILSARLSHFFDLKGPCLTLDTACSSSLVAVHLACQNLWQCECSLAVVGGVNAMLIPETTIAMSKGRFLNPDGHCRSFDADAKGYVRGEGGGIVILKRLSQAIQDKDPIYSVIRGTGVNHDGYTQGVALPNPDAQKYLIKKVLQESGIDPCKVHYVEAHGTGTPVGDPIEAQALDEVLNSDKRSYPCYLGAVKSNLGHLEAAAGVAGLIKTALCLYHRKIPPNIHFQNPNPNIPFERYCLKVPVILSDFQTNNDSLYGCVNSFGYGGTNSHAVLESFIKVKPLSIPVEDNVQLFQFSAKNQEVLKAVAKSYEEFLTLNPKVNLNDLAYTLSNKRSQFDWRMAVSAKNYEELIRKLNQLSHGENPEGSVIGKALENKPRLIFVFSGMGPQWWGMGRELLEKSPIFLATLFRCDKYIASLTDWSLVEELKKDRESSRMEDPQVAQLLNYVLQAALSDILISWGVIPEAVMGHSVGELAAAYTSGKISLEDGLLITFHRSRVQSLKNGQGTLLSVGLNAKECLELINHHQLNISVAAENGSNSTTLAGSKEDLQKIAEYLENRNIFNRFLKVNIAYHSHQMEGLEDDLVNSLHGINIQEGNIPFLSTVYGENLQNRKVDPHYWWKNVREPVLFDKVVKDAIIDGFNLFVEIGPHPVLSAYIKENLVQQQVKGGVLPTLNRSKSDINSLMECLGGLYTNGYTLQNRSIRNFIRLPAYPWSKKSYWIESEESQHYRLSSRQHPMLSRRVKSPYTSWQVEINKHHFPWLQDHKIDNSIVFPATGYVEIGLALSEPDQYVLEDIHFKNVLALQDDKELVMQVVLDPESHCFKIYTSNSSDSKEWTLHAVGKCCTYALLPSVEIIDLQPYLGLNSVDSEEIYKAFQSNSLEYGPYFRGIKRLWRNGNEALSEIKIVDSQETYHLHPASLDAAFQTLIGTIKDDFLKGNIILPSHISQIILHKRPESDLYCLAKCTKLTQERLIGDLFLCDDKGNVCVQIKGLECRIIETGKRFQNIDQLRYISEWVEKANELTEIKNKKWTIGTFGKELPKELLKSFQNPEVIDLSSIENLHKWMSKIQDEKVDFLLFVDAQTKTEAELVHISVNLVKAIEAKGSYKQITLWIATQGTQAVNEVCGNVRGSSLWGVFRVIRQEYPHLQCILVDLDPLSTDLTGLLYENRLENEIAWRGQKRFVHRLKRENFKENITLLDDYALNLKTPGLIDSLYFKEIERLPPKRGEVGVEIQSASLNFKDLMKVLGVLDSTVLDGTYFGKSFGMECVGTIVSVGPKVTKYKMGEKVCCFIPDAFQTYSNVSVKNICPVPPGDAPILIPYITVLRGLKDVAALKKGETILIHSATGAVGLAAIQYARSVGAHIIATAGNEEKRNYLRQMGIKYVGDSRSLLFVDDVKKWTGNKGVDVVLNSLSNDALLKSWDLLAPYGRFIEIGKRDISTNTLLPMSIFNRNTLFAAIDLDRIFIEQPKIIEKLLKEALNLFKKGIFTLLPCKFFPANQAVEAFQFMARAKHLGKIILQFDGKVKGIPLNKKPTVDPKGTYMVTGGFSGFGLEVAKWLINKGAKHLILVGRSGPKSAEANDFLKESKRKRIQIKAASLDITDGESLEKLLSECDKTMPPLKGIIHSAMVLHDTLISQLTFESIQEVLDPKIEGCINLHECTKGQKLDFFVLFSSITSLLGNPGQGNYAAANAFLDSFCHYRRSSGMPALTINWGALKVGVLARDEKVARYLEDRGIKGIEIERALNFLEKAIQCGESQVCALDMNWQKLIQKMPQIKQSPTFSELYEKSDNLSSQNFLEEMQALSEEQRLPYVVKILKEMVGKTIKIEPEKLDENTRLNLLGVDSLMAMELHTLMEMNLGIRIPSMELMKGPSIKQLSKLLLTL